MERKQDSFFLSAKKQKKDNKKIEKQETFKNTKFQPKDQQNCKNKRQDGFDKNRKSLQDDSEKVKKPFDKKTYRLKKYSNKYKLEQWEEQRKKKLLRNYYKEIENEPPAGKYSAKIFDEDYTDGEDVVGRFVKHPDLVDKEETPISNATVAEKPIKKDPFSKAKERFDKIKQEKLDKQKEIEQSKEEKKLKMLEYKKKKQERFKKLSKKTKKGQPVMTGRLELMLEKIQKNK